MHDRENPYRAVEIRDGAEFVDVNAVERLGELSLRYDGQRMEPDHDGTGLVVVRVVPHKVVPYPR